MFIQVIQGKVTDAESMMRQIDRWQSDVRPGAIGFLGSTAGITADDELVVMARFDSAESAQANSDRSEQGAWWSETAKCFAGDASFNNCTDIQKMMGGGSKDAGFVQIMQGTVSDVAKAKSMMSEGEDFLRSARPDVMGGVIAFHDGGNGAFTQAVYFTSEAAARVAEAAEPTAEQNEFMGEFMALFGDMTYLDLKNPRFD